MTHGEKIVKIAQSMALKCTTIDEIKARKKTLKEVLGHTMFASSTTLKLWREELKHLRKMQRELVQS